MGSYANLLQRELHKTNLSPRTHESYIRECRRFFSREGCRAPAKVREEDVTDWLLELKHRKYAPSSINMAKCGLKFFYTKVVPQLDWKIFKEFQPGKRNDRRPSLSVGETWRVLNSIHTLHNRTALVLIYLCGLRISECVNIQVGDIYRDEGQLFIHRGKGARSRRIPLPAKALKLLGQHWKVHRNPVLMFPAQGRGQKAESIKSTLKPMPLSSIQSVFKAGCKQAGLNKRGLSVHSLRHSYATHLMDLGVPLEHIKILMGHKSIITTQQYLHITEQGLGDTLKRIEALARHCHVSRS